jgi:hypothetical protein
MDLNFFLIKVLSGVLMSHTATIVFLYWRAYITTTTMPTNVVVVPMLATTVAFWPCCSSEMTYLIK